MSFRTEEKFYTDSDKYIDLKRYLILKNGKQQYSKRLISSIYFDNHKFQSFPTCRRVCSEKKIK